MNDNQKRADRLMHLVTSAIDLILRDQYEVINNEPLRIELGAEIGHGASYSTNEIERILEVFFQKQDLYPPVTAAAFDALRKERAPERLAEFLERLTDSPVETQFALSELEGADWEEILIWIDSYIVHGSRLLKEVVGQLVKEREGFISPFSAGIEETIHRASPGFLSLYVVRKYAAELRELFPRMVGRAEILRLVSTGRKVPNHVRRYLEEASRCNIYGNFLASLVLCRSAIEAAAKDRLTKRGFARELDGANNLEAILLLARDKNILDQATWKTSDEIRKTVNNAVHKDALPDENYCLRAYDITRGILQYLYK